MKPAIPRSAAAAAIRSALSRNPVVALLGPRQCGKSTLARQLAAEAGRTLFLDLENPADLAILTEPMQALANFRGLVVIDEVQRRPDLFPVLRVLADRTPRPARFLVLGSASPEMLRQSSETLAGRIAFIDLAGFTLREVGAEQAGRLWQRGGFPRSFLAGSEALSATWRDDFVRTFVERDLGQLGCNLPAAAVRRFWTMLAHYHGQTWNASEIGRSLGVSDQTTRSYLDALTGALFVRQLPPWFENLGKRQTKAPKIYIRDSGLFHTLMGLPDRRTLLGHPKLGASWEGFALEQILAYTGDRHAYVWGTHGGAEVDLVLESKGKLWGVEFKYADAPRLTHSMRSAMTDLELERLWVVHPGTDTYPLAERVDALGIGNLSTLISAVA